MSALVPDFILRMDAEGRGSGSFAAAGLFVDIPGFTQLTETLMEHGRAGAEELVRTLRFYFDPPIAAVHGAGGFVAGFAGDSFTALFPAEAAPGEAAPGERMIAAYALRAALEMRRLFDAQPERETPFGTFPFSFRIGLSWGEVSWGIVRASPERRYFYFQGPAIEACTSVEQLADRGDIVLDEAFAQRACDVPLAPIPGHAARRLVACPPPVLPPRRLAPAPEGDGLFVDPAVASAPPLGEFRNVASVFAAFALVTAGAAGASRVLGRLDPGAYAELTCLLHELATLYGGTFTGLDAGDKGTTALVHFGAPVSHENDAERALDFALELRSRAPPQLAVRAGVTCDIRYAGFNGGTDRHDYACVGRATNLAARLMMAAPWGEIWSDEQAARSVDDHYQWSPRRARRFKGFEYALQVFALERRRVSVQRQISDLGPIGREAELSRLRAIVGPLVGLGEGPPGARLVYVEGETGLGKSYLIEHFHAELQREAPPSPGFLWLDASCDQTIRGSLNAVEYAVRQHFQRSVWLDLPGRGASLEEILRALGELFRAECAARPVLVHLEDAHWADEDSLAAFAHVARACRDLPLAILVSTRRRDDGSPVRLIEPGVPAEVIELGPLRVEQLAVIASAVFGGSVPGMILEILRDNAGGNPLYAQEILSYWLADKGHTMSSITGTFTPPRGLMSLLTARLDRLDAGVRATVQAASVLGREFELSVLARMIGDPPVLARHLRVGVSQCIWRPVGQQRCRFTSVLLCNAAYEMQSRARLAELHRRAAEAILAVHDGDLDDHLTALARHFYRAGALEEARPYFLAAARKAEERGAREEAARLHRAYEKISAVESARELPPTSVV